MKKIFLGLTVLLIAAGCNSSPTAQQSLSDSNSGNIAQSTPTPTTKVDTAGPMPNMSYKVSTSNCKPGQPGGTDIDLFANAKKVGTVTTGTYLCEIDKVIFRGGNSQVVYFSVIPGGLGGAILYAGAFNLYKLDLTTGKVDFAISGSGNDTQNAFYLQSLDLSRDLSKATYIIYDSNIKGWQVMLKDLNSGSVQTFGKIPSNGQYGNIKFSPDMTKAAFAVGFGPVDAEGGEIWTVDLNSKQYSLYKKVSTGTPQVNGWTSNTTVNWSK